MTETAGLARLASKYLADAVTYRRLTHQLAAALQAVPQEEMSSEVRAAVREVLVRYAQTTQTRISA